MSRPQIFIVWRLGQAYRSPGTPVPSSAAAVITAPSPDAAIQVMLGRFGEWAELKHGEFFWAQPAFQCPREQRAEALEALRLLFEANIEARSLDTLAALVNHRHSAEIREVVLRWPESLREMQAEELRFYRKALEVEP